MRKSTLSKLRNQIHKPSINVIGNSQKEPKKVRMYFKERNSSMLFAKLDHIDALTLEHLILKFLREHNSKLEGCFIQTQ